MGRDVVCPGSWPRWLLLPPCLPPARPLPRQASGAKWPADRQDTFGPHHISVPIRALAKPVSAPGAGEARLRPERGAEVMVGKAGQARCRLSRPRLAQALSRLSWKTGRLLLAQSPPRPEGPSRNCNILTTTMILPKASCGSHSPSTLAANRTLPFSQPRCFTFS